MKKITILFFAFLLIGCGGGGGGGSDNQPPPPTINHWAKLFGRTGLHSVAHKIQQTNDGGFIAVGQTGLSAPGTGDILVIKTDDKGNILWDYSYDTGTSDDAIGIIKTNDNGFILNSYYQAYYSYLLKLNQTGNVIWAKEYISSSNIKPILWATTGGGINNTRDNGFIVCGQIADTVTSQYGIGFVMKLDSNGDNEWQKKYTGTTRGNFDYIQQTSDNGYILTGTTLESLPYQILVMRLDNVGNIVWQKSYGGTVGDYGTVVKQTRDDGFILLGSTLSYSLGSSYDIWVAKLDSSGNVQWQRVFAGVNYDEGQMIEQTSDDGYILVGNSQSFLGNDSWAFKLDRDGIVEWQRAYKGNYLYDVHQTTDQGYIATGHTFDMVQNNINNFWILKLETNGSCSPIDTVINVTANTFTPNVLVTGYVPVNILMNVGTVNVSRSSPTVDVIQQAP